MIRTIRLPALLVGALFCAPGMTSADVVHLKDGRRLEGSVAREGSTLVVRQRWGEARVAQADVLRVEETPDAWDELERLQAELGEGTAEERYRFAVFAREQGFEDVARRGFLSVLRLDLDHPGARAALGYVRHEGRWVTEEDRNRAQGLVLYQGEWMSPEEKAARERVIREEAEAARREREEELARRREERQAQREAEREERLARIKAYEEELARLRAERAAARDAERERDRYRRSALGWVPAGRTVIVNGVPYQNGPWLYNGANYNPYYRYPGASCGTYPRTRLVRRNGAVVRGNAGGSNWRLRWRIGF